jgi:hypothetical protein
MPVQKLLVAALLVPVCSVASAQVAMLRDGANIQQLLSSVSTTSAETGRMTLAERLASQGIQVKAVSYGGVTDYDIKESNGLVMKGDVDYIFATTEPGEPIKSRCPVLATFHLTKRGKSWLPDDRAANYYMFNVCKAP